MMKENIKIALLAVIAVTLVANTFMSLSGDDKKVVTTTSSSPAVVDAHDGHDHGNNDPFKLTNDVVEVPSGPPTAIAFAQSSHNFGKIKQDTQNKYKFKFTNAGPNPLIIENATGSCGCTVPEYPKEPIPPGGSGEITVEYSPGKQVGSQSKTVTITANTEPKQTMLTILADVEEVK
jgi:hypothetical protein